MRSQSQIGVIEVGTQTIVERNISRSTREIQWRKCNALHIDIWSGRTLPGFEFESRITRLADFKILVNERQRMLTCARQAGVTRAGASSPRPGRAVPVVAFQGSPSGLTPSFLMGLQSG
jgi:hypothetical protein